MHEPIIITTQKLELSSPEKPIQVGKNISESLSNYIDNARNLLRKKELNEFGVFKITKQINGKTEIYFTGTRRSLLPFSVNLKSYERCWSTGRISKKI